jgi:hypothetical protein
MKLGEFKRRLAMVAPGDDAEIELFDLLEAAGPPTREAVLAVIEFAAKAPKVEYGAPGPLVHYVEEFAGYEKIVTDEIGQRPSLTLIWMLERRMHVETDEVVRTKYRSLIRTALSAIRADESTRRAILGE